jgi:HSP20 family molecular chaperone IbpA
MELVFENGWNGNGWMIDRLASFRQAAEAATDPNTRARADVVEDKDAYHFYVEMPGIKVGSIDVQVEDDRLIVEAERKRHEWPQQTQVHLADENTAQSNEHSGFRLTRGVTAYARPTLTGSSR